VCGFSDDLLSDKFLGGLGVASELLELLLSGVPLRDLELPLDLALHRIFEVILYLLSNAQHVPELGRQRAVHGDLDPRLRLVCVGLLGLLNVPLHGLQQLLDLLLSRSVVGHDLIYLLGVPCEECQ